MATNDYCRLCKLYMREEGRSTYAHSSDIFSSKKTTSISERLALLGVIVAQESGLSNRCCHRCSTIIGRLERDLPIFRKWEEEVRESNAAKRQREPSPSNTPRVLKKTCPNPPSPLPCFFGPSQVTIKYPSQILAKVCDPDEDAVIKSIVLQRWKDAAGHILKHEQLLEEVKAGIIDKLREECEVLCSRKNDFILWRCKPADLNSFSLRGLGDDLHRLAPFLVAIFNCISNDNCFAACTAAAIALRGRQPRLAALSYYINTILQDGGAKKSVFNRLSQLSITTSHSRAVKKKRQELALDSGDEFQQFRGCSRDMESLEAPQSLEDLHLSEEDRTHALKEEDRTHALKEEDRTHALKEEDHHVTCPSYSNSTDNLDFFVHTHNQSIDRSNKNIQRKNDTHNPVQVKEEEPPCSSPDVEADNFEDYQIPITESDLTSQTFSANNLTLKDHDKKSDSDDSGSSVSGPSHRVFTSRRKTKAQKQQNKICHICSKRCWSNSGLKRHMEVHKKDKIFKCTECDKVFEDRHQLVLHEGVHKGEKPFSCDICGKKFSKNSTRIDHMKEHKRQQARACKKCGKGFYTIHHRRFCKGLQKGAEVKQRSFCCMTCGRKFYTDSDLKLHTEIHESWKRHLSEKQQENQAQGLGDCEETHVASESCC